MDGFKLNNTTNMNNTRIFNPIHMHEINNLVLNNIVVVLEDVNNVVFLVSIIVIC